MNDVVASIKTITAAALLALMCILAVPADRAYAAEVTDEQALVDEAQVTFRECLAAPEMEWFREALSGANGVMIIPGLLKAGLVFGGSGGKGVFFAKDENTGKWRGPAFYGLGSFTVGLQAGVEKSDVILLAMTHDAVKALIVPQLKLGADASVAAGPVGVGASGGVSHVTSGFVSFARSKGVFLGLTLEGLVIDVGDNSNKVYYGKEVNPEDIFISGKVESPAAEGFREEIQKAAEGGATKSAPPTVPAPQEKAPGSEGTVTPIPQEKAPSPEGTITPVPPEPAPGPEGTLTPIPPEKQPGPEDTITPIPPEPAPGSPAP